MKRILVVFIIIAMVFAISACSPKAENTPIEGEFNSQATVKQE